MLRFFAKSFSALTKLQLTARNNRFCSSKYTVQTTDPVYSILELSLPNKFRNPSVFCAQNTGIVKKFYWPYNALHGRLDDD